MWEPTGLLWRIDTCNLTKTDPKAATFSHFLNSHASRATFTEIFHARAEAETILKSQRSISPDAGEIFPVMATIEGSAAFDMVGITRIITSFVNGQNDLKVAKLINALQFRVFEWRPSGLLSVEVKTLVDKAALAEKPSPFSVTDFLLENHLLGTCHYISGAPVYMVHTRLMGQVLPETISRLLIQLNDKTMFS